MHGGFHPLCYTQTCLLILLSAYQKISSSLTKLLARPTETPVALLLQVGPGEKLSLISRHETNTTGWAFQTLEQGPCNPVDISHWF